MRNWDPDVKIDRDSAHRIVSAQFPDFANQSPRYLGRGWDNYCIEYPDGIVFRLPTRAQGANLLNHELAALPVIAERLESPQVPTYTYVGQPAQTYPYPFVGYRKIRGRTSDGLFWPSADRVRAAEELGRFLCALHTLEAEPLQTILPVDDPVKHDVARTVRRLHARLDAIESHLGKPTPAMNKALQTAEAAVQQPLEQHDRRVLHGDLYPRHVLAQAERNGIRITGIIDWGDVQVGDPAIDLSIAYTFFDAPERPTFWKAYGRQEEEFNRPRLIARAAMYGFALLAYGLDVDDPASARMGMQIIERLPNDIAQ